MGFSCLECMKRFSQVVLIITNICVAILGFAVMVVGIWANVKGKNYVDVTGSTSHILELSVLTIILGLFVLIIGVVGTVGAVFASTIFGRITLGLYAVILGLLVICEIAGGIAAAAKKDNVSDALNAGLNETFKAYSNDSAKKDSWDALQKGLRCCGLNNYSDFRTFLNISVPTSCCMNVDLDDTCSVKEIFPKSCSNAVTDALRHGLGIIAGVVIFFALMQIFGIVMACFVAIYHTKENKYEVV